MTTQRGLCSASRAKAEQPLLLLVELAVPARIAVERWRQTAKPDLGQRRRELGVGEGVRAPADSRARRAAFRAGNRACAE